jgi:hypothetical protein
METLPDLSFARLRTYDRPAMLVANLPVQAAFATKVEPVMSSTSQLPVVNAHCFGIDSSVSLKKGKDTIARRRLGTKSVRLLEVP